MPHFIVPRAGRRGSRLSLFISDGRRTSFVSRGIGFTLCQRKRDSPVTVCWRRVRGLSNAEICPGGDFTPLAMNQCVLLKNGISDRYSSGLINTNKRHFCYVFSILPAKETRSRPMVHSTRIHQGTSTIHTNECASNTLRLELILNDGLGSGKRLDISYCSSS